MSDIERGGFHLGEGGWSDAVSRLRREAQEREAERIADRKYEQREYEKLLAFKAEEKAKKEQADKEEAEHRATMRRIADSLDTIAALLARQK